MALLGTAQEAKGKLKVVELEHSVAELPVLTGYLRENPFPEVGDWDSQEFNRVKPHVKAALHTEQNGLCVYCESKLEATDGHIDHIKPKGGNNASPQLCFTYTNLAHSCSNHITCGSMKKSGLLPTEPGPGCNEKWELNSTGEINPLSTLTKRDTHLTKQTRDMLGLNKDPALINERKKWFDALVLLMKDSDDDIDQFIENAPFRYLLTTV